MHRPAAILALALLLAATLNAYAFNPESLDLLRLRLGMTEAQVTAILLRQGVSPDRIRRSEMPCPDAGPCALTIVAPAPDGELTLVLTAPSAGRSRLVHQISYVIADRAPFRPEALMASVLDRFGQPDQAIPMTWCRTPTPRQTCPEAEAWLRFWPGSQTITLRAAEPAPPP